MRSCVKGQVFLTDNEYLRRIADAAGVEGAELVVEIGMGRGELTQHLVRRARAVTAVELEERFVDEVATKLASYDNLTVVHANILDVDWAELVPAGLKAVVVGNIPYYITGPIIRMLEEERDRIARWALLVQREVAERICASPGSRAYGAMSVKLQTWGTPYWALDVPAAAFEPRPRVDSAFITYDYRAESRVSAEDAASFAHFVEFIFTGRRKKITNRLTTLLNGARSHAAVAAELAARGIDPDARPDSVPPRGYVELFNIFQTNLASG